jgi:diguanylate cyclase (GGDEF)-like protein
MAPTMLFTGLLYSEGLLGRVSPGLSQLCRVGTAVLFVWSADVFRQTNYVRPRRLKLLIVPAAWFPVAPFVFSAGTVLVSGYAAAAVFFAVAGSMYAAALLERRMIGAGLVSFVFLGLAISNVSTAVLTTRTAAAEPLLFETLLVNAVLYTLGMLGMHLLVFEDMTYELRVTNRRLEAVREELLQAAITDPLTGCQNRRFLDQVMDRELQRHSRFKLPLALLFIDINRFKAVNDTLGHEAGDRVLQYVARFLKRHIREADYVFRYGGDEFLVLITCSGEEARKKGAALKAAFDAAPEAAHLPPGIGLSVGWTEVPDGTTDLAPLVRAADERMYADKAAR